MSIRLLSVQEKIDRIERFILAERRALRIGHGDRQLLKALTDAAADYRAQLPERRPALIVRLEDSLMGLKLGDRDAAERIAKEIGESWPVIRRALEQFPMETTE